MPMVYATHRTIRDCNLEFATLFGYTLSEIVGTSFHLLYPKLDDFIRTGEMWQANLPKGKVYFDERIMARRDGTQFWCQVNGRSANIEDPFANAIYCFEPISRPVTSNTKSLTPRQLQIVTLVAQGKKNREIAEETGLSQRTVEAHRARVMRILDVKNSAEMIAWFQKP
jgi:PAS domain S-box-containing protein